MSIYLKLNKARQEFHRLKLKKTGQNKFAGYSYFELADFLIPALEVFEKNGLCGIVSFNKEQAKMVIVDTETNNQIEIESPMGSANLKGCHEVQNIGAVETYQRRYLWMAALEIVEHEAIDSSPPLAEEVNINPWLEKISQAKTLESLKSTYFLAIKACGEKTEFKEAASIRKAELEPA